MPLFSILATASAAQEETLAESAKPPVPPPLEVAQGDPVSPLQHGGGLLPGQGCIGIKRAIACSLDDAYGSRLTHIDVVCVAEGLLGGKGNPQIFLQQRHHQRAEIGPGGGVGIAGLEGLGHNTGLDGQSHLVLGPGGGFHPAEGVGGGGLRQLAPEVDHVNHAALVSHLLCLLVGKDDKVVIPFGVHGLLLAVLIGIYPLGIAGGGQIIPEGHGQVVKDCCYIIRIIYQVDPRVKILGKHPVIVRVHLCGASGNIHTGVVRVFQGAVQEHIIVELWIEDIVPSAVLKVLRPSSLVRRFQFCMS